MLGDKTYMASFGNNTTEPSNYAKLVLATDGVNYLSNVVDISANSENSAAIDQNGEIYVWGNRKIPDN